MGKKFFSFLISTFFTVFLFSGCSTVYNPATGNKHVSIISTSKEIEIGKSLSEKVEKHFGLVYDIESQSRIEKIGNKLADVSFRESITYHFDILDEDEPNAISLPGGYIYITKGLFDKLDTDDQIASVLAHEMAHIETRHSIYRLQKALGYGALLVIVSKSTSPRAKKDTLKAINELFLSYSREDEFEADRLALKYLSQARYDPHAMLETLDKLRQINRKKPIERLHLRTHPYIYDRIREIKILLNGKIDFTDYINETQTYGTSESE